MDRQVVLGAGPLGTALSGQLSAAGSDVSLYSIMGETRYDMPGTSPPQIDGTDADVLAATCRGADVIYLLLNAHYVDWHDLYPPRLTAAISAASTTGATLVYHDNVYMHGPAGEPLTEEHPHDAGTRKGALRSAMASEFLEAARSRTIRGTIGRSPDMYGPGALNSSYNSTLGERHFKPMLQGKGVAILGDADQPHTYGYVPDVAAGLATLGSHPESLGEVWHLPSAPTLSHRDLLEIAFELVGTDGRVRSSALSAFFVKLIGRFQDDVGELGEILYQFEKPLVVSHDKFADRFGVSVTPHREALETTIGWYRADLSGARTA